MKLKFFICLLFVCFFCSYPAAVSAAAEDAKITMELLDFEQQGSGEEYVTSADFFVILNSTYPLKTIYYVPEKTTDIKYIIANGQQVEYASSAFFLEAVSEYYTVYAEDYWGNTGLQTFHIDRIDSEAPVCTLKRNKMLSDVLSYHIYNFTIQDAKSKAVSLKLADGFVEDASDMVWENEPNLIDSQTISVKNPGIYTMRTEDSLGNASVTTRYLGTEELRAVWVSYLEYESKGYSSFEAFKAEIDAMFNHVAAMNMNAVIVHVRPFGDAMYQSQYFPWSKYSSGTQGVDPGFDPLAYMVKAAHQRGLQIHAWLNPYRITNNTTNVKTLSKDNPARIWREDASKKNDRNVLSYGGKLYYNPAKEEVQDLIVNGIAELVANYDIDGIHFDDYFYPSLGKNNFKNFDSEEYTDYLVKQIVNRKPYTDIAQWRRDNVSNLLKKVYSTIKAIDKDCEFGVSPGGFYRLLSSKTQYYVDYERWMSEEGFLDYICPQIYWTNGHATYPYEKTLNHWLSKQKTNVKVYVGIAAYKAGTKSEEPDWYKNPNVLADQISYARNTNAVSGFMFFRYDTFNDKANYTSLKNMLKELKKQ